MSIALDWLLLETNWWLAYTAAYFANDAWNLKKKFVSEYTQQLEMEIFISVLMYGSWHQINADISGRLDNDWNYFS